MCFGADSRPPIRPIAGGELDAGAIELEAADGNRFRGWRARRLGTAGRSAGMLVLPDQRGLHPYYETLAMRFAELGYDALAIDWYGRTAGVAPRGADFDEEPHIPGLSYAGLAMDVAAAAAWLRRDAGTGTAPDRPRPGVDRLFAIGFCLGGRLALLEAAGDLRLAGAIGYYGRPTGQIVWGGPAPIEVVDRLNAPLLGIFAGRDRYIPAERVREYEAVLAARNADAEILLFPEAPHSFFDILADEYAVESTAAWEATLRFLARPDLTSGSGRSS